MGKYKYYLLNSEEEGYFYEKVNGFSKYMLGNNVLGYCYLPFKVGQITDIPLGAFVNFGGSNPIRPHLQQNRSMVIFPFKVTKYTSKPTFKTVRSGIERGFAYFKQCYRNNVGPGELIKVTPESKKGDRIIYGDPFYVGNGLILDKNMNLLFGVFIRIKKEDAGLYTLKECVLKVSENLFLQQKEPLHKIIMQEVLPDCIGYYFKYNFIADDYRMYGYEDDPFGVMLPISLEMNNHSNPLERIAVPEPDLSNEDICRQAIIHTENVRAL